MNSKAVRLVGLCRRANCLVSGDNAVNVALNKLSCYLIIAAADASESIVKRFKLHCSNLDIPMLILSTKRELGEVIGKGDTAIIGITSKDFAKGIMEAVKS